jgi:signal transduction histidine kinase
VPPASCRCATARWSSDWAHVSAITSGSAPAGVALDGRVRARRGLSRLVGVVVTVAAAIGGAALGIAGAVAIGEPESWVAAGAVVAWAAGAIVLGVRVRDGAVPALVAAVALFGGVALLLTDPDAIDGVGADWRAVTLGVLGGVLGHLAIALPDGVVSGRRWLTVAAVYAIGGGIAVALVQDAPHVGRAAVALGSLALVAVAAPAIVHRCRDAGAIERSQLQWIGCAAVVAVTLTALAAALSDLTGWPEHVPAVAAAVSAAMPAALVLATFPRALAYAPGSLVHTIVVSGMVLLATITYLVIVVGFDGAPTDDERATIGLSLLAAALIAVVALPVRRRLEVFANQRVYGERESPDTALHTFAHRMSRAVPMDELLRQLAESLCKSMDLRRAEVWTGSDGLFDLAVSVPARTAARISLGPEEQSVAARAQVSGNAWLDVWVPGLLEGRADQVLRVAPVAHLGELLGFIVVEQGTDEATFDEDHDRALFDVARQLGLALHNVSLDTALQASLDELQVRNTELVASRARIVSAADESRRRIERNLHDGAQQHLVAMAVKLGLTRQLVEADPGKVADLLVELRADVQVTLGELRELAHGIYPPLLRSRGLPEALTAAANRAVLPTTVLTDELPRFDPDVEAAAYFCCLEAVQNAGKHAGGGALVTIALDHVDGALTFEVIDDGAGFDRESVVEGDGFVNMADRVGAWGGTLTVTSEPGAGTRVRGAIPAEPLPPGGGA